MKKFGFVLAILGLVSLISCRKEIEKPIENSVNEGITTFRASMPETRTVLDRPHVNWAVGDQIRVIGYTDASTIDQATFTLQSGEGNGSAVFAIDEGQTMGGSHTSYFAFYPANIAINTTTLPDAIEVKSGITTLESQEAVENGFDPSLAIMTAKADADGNLAFRHGVAYVGIQIPDDGITALAVEFGKNAVQKRPEYSAADGSITKNNSGTNKLKAVGSFVKGSYYYLCAIPNTGNKMTSVKVTYTHNGVEKSVTTTSMADDKLEPGKLYDFGCPPLKTPPPVISASAQTIPFDATNGSIEFAIQNPVSDGVLAVEKVTEDAGWFTLGTIGAESVSFVCNANDAEDAVERSVKVLFTYTYNGTETVTKEVSVTQLAKESPGSHSYVFYMDASGSVVQLKDGEACDYFTVTGTSKLQCAASGYFGVDSYTVDDLTLTYAKKIDSSNGVSFTARAGYSSTARFYCASRNTNTTATMNLLEGTTKKKTLSLTWTDNKADLIDSGEIILTPEGVYSFSKSGEVGLFYVVVTETPQL